METPKFRKLPAQNCCPQKDWFDHLPLPTGRTFKCIGRDLINLDHVERQNEHGQILNVVRELGTDRDNRSAIVNNIQVNGVLLDAQPPFLSTQNVLFDGFTRYDCFKILKASHWVFNIVEPKEGFTWDDVRDEIGLGANNHVPSKPATEKDFEKRLCAWIASQDEVPSNGKCVDWIDSIPHSFTRVRVTKIATRALNSHATKNSMESLTPPDVVQKTVKSVDLPKGTKVLPLNINGNKTYFQRLAFDKINAINDEKVSDTFMVGYTTKTSAEDVSDVRRNGLLVADEINQAFEKVFQERSRRGESFKLIDIKAFAPQIIGVEEDLIHVEEDEKGS